MLTLRSDFADRVRSGWGPVPGRTTAAMSAAFARTEKAHQRRLGHAALSPETLRDIGMSAEDATGIPSRQPDLPFFMQANFGRS